MKRKTWKGEMQVEEKEEGKRKERQDEGARFGCQFQDSGLDTVAQRQREGKERGHHWQETHTIGL